MMLICCFSIHLVFFFFSSRQPATLFSILFFFFFFFSLFLFQLSLPPIIAMLARFIYKKSDECHFLLLSLLHDLYASGPLFSYSSAFRVSLLISTV
jgi:hypothetical protein